MNWIRGLGISVKVAVSALLMVMALLAAKRAKDTADKWRNNAVEIENGYVIKGVETAAAANTQALVHDEKAKQIKAKAEIRITQMGNKHEDVADILARWTK